MKNEVNNIYQQKFNNFLEDHPTKKTSIDGNVWKYFVSKEVSAEKEYLVILHGGGSIAEATHAYFIDLEQKYNIIAPTIPGGIDTVEKAIDGIMQILKDEKVKNFNLLGFSMGGMIAQCMLRKMPNKIHKLILFVTMLPSKSYAKKYQRHGKTLKIFPKWLVSWISKKSLKRQILSEKVEASNEEKQFWVDFFAWSFDNDKMNRAMLVSTALLLVDYFGNYDFGINDLDEWHGKLLIFESDKDRVVNQEERDRLRALYPQAAILTMENSGHFGTGLVNVEPVLEKMNYFLER